MRTGPNKFLQLILTRLFLTASTAMAGSGINGGDFLNVPYHARGSSLGGAWLSGEGTGALYYNPSSVGQNGIGELSLSHSELFQDLRFENLSLVMPLNDRMGIGASVSYLGYGEITGYDNNGIETGEVSAYSLMTQISVSQKLTDVLAVGLSVKPVFEKLASQSAQAVTFDLGASAELGQFMLVAGIANWGGRLRYVSESAALPTTLRAGISYRTPLSGSALSLAVSQSRGTSPEVASGLEYHYNSAIALRCGYSGNFESEVSAADGLNLGLGFILSPMAIDYAYHPSTGLGGVHQITASYRFGR